MLRSVSTVRVQVEQVQVVDIWTAHLSRPRRFELKVPGWLQVGTKIFRPGCPWQRVKWTREVGESPGQVRCEPRWRQAGVSLAEGQVDQCQDGVRPGCPWQRVKWARGWGVPRTSVRCEPSWRQAGVSPAEGQVGQRLGSPQDKCPSRAKRVSSGSPAEASQGREVGASLADGGQSVLMRAEMACGPGALPARGELTAVHLGWRLMSMRLWQAQRSQDGGALLLRFT